MIVNSRSQDAKARTRFIRILILFSSCLLSLAFFSGCSTGKAEKASSLSGVEALPPAFITGAAAAILTNAGAFSAHVVLSNDMRMPKITSGQLFSLEGKLLFAAEPVKDKKNSGGAFAYVSDIVNHQSFVWSEGLQGYAPAALALSPTNLTIQQVPGGLQRFAGHVCDAAEATVQMSDGAQAKFKVLRALDLNRVPVHISAVSSAAPFSLTLSQIRLTPPPADVFTPPADFTRYESPEMMVTELIMRQHNLRRKSAPSSAPETIYDSRTRR